MRLPPQRQSRHQPAGGKGVRRRYAQWSPRGSCADTINRLRKRLEAIPDEWKELLAGRGQRHRTRLPSEQRLTAVSFQQLDLMAYGGGRHPKFGGGPLKTQTTRR